MNVFMMTNFFVGFFKNLIIEANEDAIPDTLGQERDDASSFPLLPASGQPTFDVSSVNLPHDQMQTIENIHTLISEVPSTPYIFSVVNF